MFRENDPVGAKKWLLYSWIFPNFRLLPPDHSWHVFSNSWTTRVVYLTHIFPITNIQQGISQISWRPCHSDIYYRMFFENRHLFFLPSLDCLFNHDWHTLILYNCCRQMAAKTPAAPPCGKKWTSPYWHSTLYELYA
jgi:hypothetical protein